MRELAEHQTVRVPARDPGSFAVPALVLACIIAILVRPAAVAVPLAALSAMASWAFSKALRARMVASSPLLLAIASVFLVLLGALRPSLFFAGVPLALLAVFFWATTRLSRGGVADSLFGSALAIVVTGFLPAHAALAAVSPFAGGESMGRPLVIVSLIATGAAIAATAAAAASLTSPMPRKRADGGLGADLAGLLAAILVCLIASTLKKPDAGVVAFLALALTIEAGVALGRRFAWVLTTGGGDPQELVSPAEFLETKTLERVLPLAFASAGTYYLGRLLFT